VIVRQKDEGEDVTPVQKALTPEEAEERERRLREAAPVEKVIQPSRPITAQDIRR
jgi:hypothetical protein